MGKLNWKPYILAVIGLLVSGLFMGNYVYAASMANLTAPSTPSIADFSANRNTYVVQAVKKVGPAVVGITNKAYMRDNFNQKVLVDQGVGSGVVFDANGYIVTNFHVVKGAQAISVSLSDGRTLDGKVLGTDPATDLALVKIDATNLPTVSFGDSASIQVGEPAIAIGNPLGLEFSGSVTVGVISALNRTIEIGDRKFKLIQTDAAINPGNSGGALVNADGQVIGINSAKIAADGVEGMGFAIPINSVRPILQSLLDKGRVIRAYLGIGILDATTAAQYGYDLDIDHGVFIVRIEKGGPAAKVNMQEGDVIVKINGTDVNSVADLRSILDTVSVGSTVDITLERNGETFTVSPRVTEMPH